MLEVASSKLQQLGLQYPDAISFGKLPSTPGADHRTLPQFVNLRDMSGLTCFATNPIVVLNLRQTDGDAKLLANPRIRVKNRDKAKVHIGEKVPVITTTSTANVGVSSSVSYLDVGLKLDVEPNIYLRDEVAIKVSSRCATSSSSSTSRARSPIDSAPATPRPCCSSATARRRCSPG